MLSIMDKRMVNYNEDTIDLTKNMSIYGFSEEKITMHKACRIKIKLKER